MKRKTNIAIVAFLLIIVMAIVSAVVRSTNRTNGASWLSGLKLDQGDAYIAISSNDMTGYNRWIPFYFLLKYDPDSTAESIESLLIENIKQASFYSDEGKILFRNANLIWSALKIDDKTYNLSMVVVPELDEFTMEKPTNINSITFDVINGDVITFDLPNYVVESKETVDEKKLYVALSTTEAEVQSNLIINVQYGILGNTELNDFSLYYPSGFANIANYVIYDRNKNDEGVDEYSVAISVSEHNKKTIFRPFIQVQFEDSSGWLVPTLPVYIH